MGLNRVVNLSDTHDPTCLDCFIWTILDEISEDYYSNIDQELMDQLGSDAKGKKKGVFE